MVSVIIPVYNAAAYVEQAVQSALDLPQTGEVLLIEDGSTDTGTLPACRQLAERYDSVRLLQHPGGRNRGPGCSRNLGMANATCDYVAFLDADDFYLPNRFAVAETVFRSDASADAIYEMTGTHFESEKAESIWRRQKGPDVSCIEPGIPPGDLFEQMFPIGKRGKCHMNALTIRRSALDKIGVFPDFGIGEDTVFVMKVAASIQWVPGQLDAPVAMRRVHEENRTTGCATSGEVWAQSGMGFWRGRTRLFLVVLRWLCKQPGQDKRIAAVTGAIRRESKRLISGEKHPLGNAALQAYCFANVLRREPRLLGQKLFVRGCLRDIYNCLRK